MKRFHVHVSVEDLASSIRFYSALFGSEPSRREPDYAKWMLEDPRVNFAVSTRGRARGVNHLGFQVDSAAELEAMRAQVTAADSAVVTEAGVACCYARSDKYWVNDPAGIPWETFHTLGTVPFYGEADAKPCCADAEPLEAAAPCCPPAAGTRSTADCCAAQG